MTGTDKCAMSEACADKPADHDVQAIRAKYVRRVITHRMLAKEYGVTKTTVCNILNGKTWTA